MTGIEGLNVREVQENEVKLPKLEITNYEDFKDKFDDNFLNDIKNGDLKISKVYASPDTEEEEETEEGNKPKFTPTENKKKKELYYIFERSGLGRNFRVREDNLKTFVQIEQTNVEKDALLEEVLLKTNVDVQKNDIREQIAKDEQTKEIKRMSTTGELPPDIKTNADLLVVVDGLISDLERFTDEDPTLGKINNPLNAYSKDAKEQFKALRYEAKVRLGKLKKLRKELEKMPTEETTMPPTMATQERVIRYRDEVKDMKSNYIGQAIFGNVSLLDKDIDTQKEAKRAKEYQLDMIRYNAEMDKLLQEQDLAMFLNEDLQGFKEYLKDIATGEITDLEHNPFYLKNPVNAALLIAFILQFPQKYPYFYSCIMRIKNAKLYVAQGTQGISQETQGGGAFDKGGRAFSDLLVKTGIIDKNDPQKREAWAKFGKVGLLVGAVALGFTILKKLFSKDKDKWKRVGGGVLGLFALSNVDGLQNWFKTAFGKKNPTAQDIEHMTNVDTSPEYQDRVPPVLTTMQTIGGVPIKTLIDGGYITESGGKFTLHADMYKTHIEGGNLPLDQKKSIKEGIEKVEKNSTIINKGLHLLNIHDIDDLKTLAGSDEKKTLTDVDNLAEFFTTLASKFNADLKKRGLKPKDEATWYIINKEYSQTGSLSETRIQELKDQGLLVEDKGEEKKETKDDDNVLPRWSNIKPEVVKDISLADAIKELQKKGIDVQLVGGNKISSYGKEVVIDPVKKTINSLDITFTDNVDLVGAASFINFVRVTTENKTPKDSNPFNIKLDGNLYFNDTNWYDITSTDTKIVNAGFTNTLKKISPSLDKNNDTFKDYLNKTRLWVKSSLEKSKNDIYNDYVSESESFLDLLQDDKEEALQTGRPSELLAETFTFKHPKDTDIMDISKPYEIGVKSKGVNTNIFINRANDNNRLDKNFLAITFSDYEDLVEAALFTNTCIQAAKTEFKVYHPYSETPFQYKDGKIFALRQGGANVDYRPIASVAMSPISESDAMNYVQYLNQRYKANKKEFGMV